MLVHHRRNLLLFIVLPLITAACGRGGDDADDQADAPVPPLVQSPVPPQLPTPLSLALRQVASGLDAPVFLTAPAGDRRQFIVERAGRIRILQDGLVLAPPFLDISARVLASGEGGLLSMAFHPLYASNGQYFIFYTNLGGDIVIERRTVSANPNVSDPVAALEILRIPHPGFSNHYGGLLAFGPDGYLYLGTGDGGGGGDPAGNAQNPNVLLGKILRIDVNAATAGASYAIAASNPFIGQAGRRAEIWALGLRNPWRFAFDAGALYIADVGQGRQEEVHIQPATQAGLNYGWNILEGSLCYNAATCNRDGLLVPAFEYAHGAGNINGCSIIGGDVYRGVAIPELAGRYFFSDFCAGYIKSFVAAGTGVTDLIDSGIPKQNAIVSFGRDADGELYLISANGTVSKIVRAAP